MPAGMTTLTALTVANGERLSWGRRTYVMGVINVTPNDDKIAGRFYLCLNQDFQDSPDWKHPENPQIRQILIQTIA